MFECDMCGECCRNLRLSELYSDLDDGTGKCIYLDGNKCSIYNNRPLKCRIDDSYEAFFKEEISKDEYYRLNYQACAQLKMKEGGMRK